jgi:hypothetical protein
MPGFSRGAEGARRQRAALNRLEATVAGGLHMLPRPTGPKDPLRELRRATIEGPHTAA